MEIIKHCQVISHTGPKLLKVTDFSVLVCMNRVAALLDECNQPAPIGGFVGHPDADSIVELPQVFKTEFVRLDGCSVPVRLGVLAVITFMNTQEPSQDAFH